MKVSKKLPHGFRSEKLQISARPADYVCPIDSGIVSAQQVPGFRDADNLEMLRAPQSPPAFRDHCGPVLSNVRVQLIFWGGSWARGATPSAAHVTSAVRAMLTGPYMTGLRQYRGIGNGSLCGTTIIAGGDPPDGFSTNNVECFVDDLIVAGTVPRPESDLQILYCVVMPEGAAFVDPRVVGEHSYFPASSGAKVHYAWSMNSGDIEDITIILSHELVESCTDPEGSAILGEPGSCGNTNTWCEIADVCRIPANVNGVTVQPYWSQADGKCIVPGAVPL